MTDLFTRLAARQLGTARILTPQIPGLFEPHGASDDGFVEQAEERAAPARPEARPAQETPLTPPVVTPPDPPDRDLPARVATQPSETAPRPERAETRIERQVTHDHHETRRDVVTETQRVAQEMQVIRREETIRHAAEPAPVTEDAAANAAVPVHDTELPLAKDPPAQVVPPPPAAPLPPPAVDVIPQAAPQVQAPPQPPERRVDVHIGHLEIRAAPPPARTARPRRSPKNPAPDLNTYLRDRR